MASPSSHKTPNFIHVIFSKKPPSSSFSRSMKLKTLIKTFILSHIHRIARPVAKAKSILLELLRDLHFNIHPIFKKNKHKKLIFGSFRLHYNWCSSHVMPVSQESYSNSHVYYDSSWHSMIPTTTFGCDDHMIEFDELSRYLEWLEEKGNQESCTNDIDKLADLFIANCHEKFRLEKQESYRRSQEMMSGSM